MTKYEDKIEQIKDIIDNYDLDELVSCCSYLDGDEAIYSMDDFDEILCGRTPWEITWKTNIDGVSITKWHFVDGQSQEIVKQINQIGQDISHLWGDTTKALPKLIEQLQQKKDELDKATERALAITADAVLKNYR